MTGLDLRTIAYLLGGDVVRNGVLAPGGPTHSRGDRSMSVSVGAHFPDGILINSFASDDPLQLKDYVFAKLGLSRERPQRLRSFRPAAPPPARNTAKEDASRSACPLRIWEEAHPPFGTPAELYLKRRALALPPDAETVIRYHSRCPFGETRTPAMIALVRDLVSDAPVAVHRTAVGRDGSKVVVNGESRLSLGPVRSAAIKLSADETVCLSLAVAEGIETALSLRHVAEAGGTPVWAMISAGGIERLPMLSGIESLFIAVDHDPTGMKAAQVCADRWRSAGREVVLIRPVLEGSDLNDALKGSDDA